jgi:hypothetical protein
MTRAPRLTFRIAAAIGLLALLATACVNHPDPDPSTIATTTSAPPTTSTTTTTLPAALQPTAPAAAAALVAAWAARNTLQALTVATVKSVEALFAAHYSPGLAIDRGCSTAFPPLVCTYGPPGGAPPTDPIYEIYVSTTPGGWYVSSVQIDS